MFARISLTALVSFCFLSIGMQKDCFADVSAQLKQAEALKDNRKYDQAEAIYQQIVTAFPDTNDALEAQKQLVLIYTATYKQQQADTAFEQLVTEFSEHKNIAEAVWQIANAHGQTEEYNKTFQLHQYNVEHFPDDMYAMRSQMEIVRSYIYDGNDTAADAAIDKLLSVFSDQPDLPKEIYQIVERYKKQGRCNKALELNKYSVEHFPNHKYAMWSQVEIVYSHVRDGNDTAADEAVDKLINVFSGQPDLPKEIYQIAMKYNEAERKDKAVGLHQYNVDHSSKDDMYTMWSQVEIIKSHILDSNNIAADETVDKLLTMFSNQSTLPKEIYQIAITYNEAGRKDRALQLHSYNVEHSSKDNKYTMWSQLEIIKSHILDGDNVAADEAVDKLLTVFSDQPTLPMEIYQLSDRFNNAGRADKAGQLYQYIINTWPDDRYAMLAQDSISGGSYSNNNEAVDHDELTVSEAIDKLLTEPNTDSSKDIPEVLSEITAKYCKAGSYEKAIQLCQYVIDNWGDNTAMVISGKLEMAKVYIAEGNDATVEVIVDELITNYGGNPASPDAVFMIGEEYYNKAHNVKGDPNLPKEQAEEHYRKAQTVWEKLINEFPPSGTYTPLACSYAAACYRRLGNYEKAIEYYEKVVQDWPNYEYAWHAQVMVARCYYYEELERSGHIITEDAAEQIRQACKKLLTEYPDSQAVEATHYLLEDMNVMTPSRKE